MSRAPKSATIKNVFDGRMITERRAKFSCIAVLLIPADYFAVSLILTCRDNVYFNYLYLLWTTYCLANWCFKRKSTPFATFCATVAV